YNRINDDMVTVSAGNPDEAEKLKTKQKKLDGIIILDDDEDVPGGIISDMDSELISRGSSEFLNVALKKDNSLTKASQVTTRANFDILEKYAAKTAVDTDRQIKSGNISINPCKNGENTVCTYCKFREACMFDTEYDSFRRLPANDDIAMELMRKEISDDEQK
ncbi:MAG: hypothetical protein PUE13_04820, partial [Clostridiales bacterium]|nr:hypothetical protein [Clostridiales bacterium]